MEPVILRFPLDSRPLFLVEQVLIGEYIEIKHILGNGIGSLDVLAYLLDLLR